MNITDEEIKTAALNESMRLHEMAAKEEDPAKREHRRKLLLHLSIYNLAQGIVAQADGVYDWGTVLVESMEIKDLIIDACGEIMTKIQTGELKFSKGRKDGTGPTE